MAVRTTVMLPLLLLTISMSILSATSSSPLLFDTLTNPFTNSASAPSKIHPLACRGAVVAECNDDEKIAGIGRMDLEAAVRRGLAANTRYISYEALKKDRVPCNRRGNSYYNCQRGKRANPYRRGCSVITHCQKIYD